MFHENMSRVCEICGRGTTSGATRSHSNIATLRKVKINIQKKKIGGKSAKICTRCSKTKVKTK
jgi:large subunit ribosomal protein L28